MDLSHVCRCNFFYWRGCRGGLPRPRPLPPRWNWAWGGGVGPAAVKKIILHTGHIKLDIFCLPASQEIGISGARALSSLEGLASLVRRLSVVGSASRSSSF